MPPHAFREPEGEERIRVLEYGSPPSFLYRTRSDAPVSVGRNKSRLANTGCYRGLITQSRPVRRYPSRLFTKKSSLSQQSIFLSSLVPFPCSHYGVSKSRNSRRSGETDRTKFPLANMISIFHRHHYCPITDIESELRKR